MLVNIPCASTIHLQMYIPQIKRFLFVSVYRYILLANRVVSL